MLSCRSVPAMIVGNYGKALRASGVSKAGIATGMFGEPMQYLDNAARFCGFRLPYSNRD